MSSILETSNFVHKISTLVDHKISLIVYTYDEYSTLIKYVIKSFDNLIYKTYILSFDIQQIKNINDTDDMIEIINLSEYDYNINKCVNNLVLSNILSPDTVWVLWRPTFIFNQNKRDDFIRIISNIRNNVHDLVYIYGIELYLDIYHTDKIRPYTCRNGGCVIANNRLALVEDANMYQVDKKSSRIQYNLYDKEGNDYYFFNIAKAYHSNYMLLDIFTDYVNQTKISKYRKFSEWYKINYNKSPSVGKVYAEKMYLTKINNIEQHSIDLPRFIVDNFGIYDFNGKSRVQKFVGKFRDVKITIVTLVRNNKHFIKNNPSNNTIR